VAHIESVAHIVSRLGATALREGIVGSKGIAAHFAANRMFRCQGVRHPLRKLGYLIAVYQIGSPANVGVRTVSREQFSPDGQRCPIGNELMTGAEGLFWRS
jgi:hypothetical protein